MKMKIQVSAIGLFLTVMAGGSAFAVGPDKLLQFKGSPKGIVIFNGTTHKNAGLTCSDCHNPDVFPKMKFGTVKISMDDLYAGKYCGKCHNGTKAFLIMGNCERCHHKLEDD